MRLLNYLNEMKFIRLPDEDQIKLIKKDCKKYIRLTKKTGPFYRGLDEKPDRDEILIKDVRQDRQPLGTKPEAYIKLNNWLEKNGHTRRDKSVCVSTSKIRIQNFFGKAFKFFPIGNFDYTWIRSIDINMDDFTTDWNDREVEYFFGSGNIAKTEKDFKSYFTTNKGIEKAHKNYYETWFNCKQYYCVNREVNTKEIYK